MKTAGNTKSCRESFHQNIKWPVGEIFFFPRGNTFVKILSVEAKPSLPDCQWNILTYLNLKTGQEHGANFLEEIGEEFFPLPPGFTTARVEEYLTAAKEYEKAQQIMMDVDHEILLNRHQA